MEICFAVMFVVLNSLLQERLGTRTLSVTIRITFRNIVISETHELVVETSTTGTPRSDPQTR